MGGYGSGWQGPKKEVVDDCLIISTSYGMRQGMLKAGIRSFDSLTWSNRSGNSCPETWGVTNRDTGVVVRELFGSAEAEVIVAEFAVYRARTIFQRWPIG